MLSAKSARMVPGAASVGRFSDGEVTVEINTNVRARDVFVVQPTCAPTNENLMELLIMVDALKRSSAARITAAAFGKDPGFYDFYRRMQAYRKTISNKDTQVILSPDGEFLKGMGSP